eukprot:scaffold5150_cov133-Skeletonema_menzelii.AAC.10
MVAMLSLKTTKIVPCIRVRSNSSICQMMQLLLLVLLDYWELSLLSLATMLDTGMRMSLTRRCFDSPSLPNRYILVPDLQGVRHSSFGNTNLGERFIKKCIEATIAHLKEHCRRLLAMLADVLLYVLPSKPWLSIVCKVIT